MWPLTILYIVVRDELTNELREPKHLQHTLVVQVPLLETDFASKFLYSF